MTRLVTAIAFVLGTTIACESHESESEPELLVCDTPGPIRLLDVSLADVSDWSMGTTHAANHIVAHFSALTPKPTRYISATHLVDVCGTSARELIARSDTAADERIGAAGPWILGKNVDTSAIRWIDPDAEAPSHVVFAEAHSCLVHIRDGLAAIDAAGTLWFNPDPSDPTVEPVELGHDVVVGAGGGNGLDFGCREGDPDAPTVDADGLLVIEGGGPFVRISVPAGERETIIDAAVAVIAMLDDPRYLVWLEGTQSTPECCEMRIRDRVDGDDIDLGSAGSIYAATRRGSWVAVYVRDPPTMVLATTFVDAETAARITIDGEWDLTAQLSATKLLIQTAPVDPVPHILDVVTGANEPIDFPEPSRFDPTYADGVLGFEPDGGWDRGTLKLLRRESLAIETLAYVQPPYARMRDGTIVFIEHALDDDPTGTLVVLRDGERHEIARDVRVAEIPYLAKDRELPEIIYTALGPDGSALWRYELP